MPYFQEGVIVISLGLLVGICVNVLIILPHLLETRRVNKMIRKLKTFRNELCYNINNDVMAVCRNSTFNMGISEHHEMIGTGHFKVWDTVVSRARPLFIFAGSLETLRPVHTGLRTDFEEMLDQYILRVTNYKLTSIKDKRLADKVRSMILRRDSRLFVPYSATSGNLAEQFEFYGNKDLTQARNDLFPSL